uniref:Glucuronosyltransferase n=1 Tax=Panagrolaimus sp. ES5 TaxID=591445 RepID=A0AC34G274_9BILA
MGRIADTLAAAGHEIVVYQPVIAENIKFTRSKNETIRFYTTPKKADDDFRMEEAQEDFWDPESLDKIRRIALWYGKKNTLVCKNALEDEKTLEQLKNEKFDLGISEIFSGCGFGIFKLIELERYIAASSCSLMFYNYDLLGLKYHLSYVPSMFSLKPDKMTFSDRIVNYLLSFVDHIWSRKMFGGGIDELMQQRLPGFKLEEAISDSAFHFINSDEIIDYTQPITQKVVYIGGLGKVQSHPLNDELSKIFDSSKKDHPRLLAFISHAGMNSVIEGTSKGIPMICIPIFGDQFHNSVLIENRGTGISLQKDHLTKGEI